MNLALQADRFGDLRIVVCETGELVENVTAIGLDSTARGQRDLLLKVNILGVKTEPLHGFGLGVGQEHIQRQPTSFLAHVGYQLSPDAFGTAGISEIVTGLGQPADVELAALTAVVGGVDEVDQTGLSDQLAVVGNFLCGEPVDLQLAARDGLNSIFDGQHDLANQIHISSHAHELPVTCETHSEFIGCWLL